MRHLLFLLSFAIQICAQAQVSNDVVRVKNGSDITKLMPFTDRFQYESFKDGKVFFRNGRVVNAKLNYSLPHGEVQFVDAKKDTMILTDKNFISKITIAADTFFYSEKHGHVRKIADFGDVGLAEKQFIAQIGSERHSAYNQYTSTSAISTYSSFTNSSGMQQALEGNDKVLIKKRAVYFFIDKNQDLHLANKGSILKVFPKHKKAINQYFKDNKTEFEDLKDISAALEYASSL